MILIFAPTSADPDADFHYVGAIPDGTLPENFTLRKGECTIEGDSSLAMKVLSRAEVEKRAMRHGRDVQLDIRSCGCVMQFCDHRAGTKTLPSAHPAPVVHDCAPPRPAGLWATD